MISFKNSGEPAWAADTTWRPVARGLTWLGGCLAVLAIGACQTDRPDGAFMPSDMAAEEPAVQLDSGPSTMLDEVFDRDDTTPNPVFADLEGTYMLSSEVRGTLRHERLGDFESLVTTYSLFHVVSDGEALFGYEQQCHILYENQPAAANFNTLDTFVADSVPTTTPMVRRELLVQPDGQWVTLRAPVAVGWAHAYPPENQGDTRYAPRQPPVDVNDALVDNWEDTLPGVTIRSRATYLGAPQTCETYVAQRVDPVYSGRLDNDLASGGLFDTGQVDASANLTAVLAASRPDCADDMASSSVPGPAADNALRLVRLEEGEPGQQRGAPCPTVSDFLSR